MSILIYADSNNGALTKNAFEAVSYGAQLAQQTGSSAVAIVTGTVSGIEDLGKYGVSKVLHASDASLDNFDPQKITHVIDTTGAGENFAAGFLDQYLLNKTIEEALAQGNARAAEIIQQLGPRIKRH